MEQLRRRIHKVEGLRQEQEPQGFAEMPKYAIHCKNHSCKIAICVPNKHLGRIPVVKPQG